MKKIIILFISLYFTCQFSLLAQNQSKAATEAATTNHGVAAPIASIGGLTIGEVTIQALLDAGKLVISDPAYTLQGFNFYMTRTDKDPISIESTGAEFPDLIIQAIQTAVPGNKIVFENIKLAYKADKISFAEAINFTIK